MLNWHRKNIATLLAIMAIIIGFYKDEVKPYLLWLLFTVIIYLGMLYVIDCIKQYFYDQSNDGKFQKAVEDEKRREALDFGKKLFDADRKGKLLNDWSDWYRLRDEKTKQIHTSNVILFNAWLKKQLKE